MVLRVYCGNIFVCCRGRDRGIGRGRGCIVVVLDSLTLQQDLLDCDGYNGDCCKLVMLCGCITFHYLLTC
jgi:hypothetical protein